MFPSFAIFSSWSSYVIVFFSSLKLCNTLYLLCPLSHFFFGHCPYPILLYHMIVFNLFTSQEYKLLKRRGSIAYILGFPTLLTKCHVHGSYSIDLSNSMSKDQVVWPKPEVAETNPLTLSTSFFISVICLYWRFEYFLGN